MEHYYSESPGAGHKMIEIEYALGDLELTFESDLGVFSKNRIDYGSHILVKSLPPLKGKLLDLGCGYGPIGIALACINPSLDVLMVDINRRAVDLAEKNISKNLINNARAIISRGFENIQESFNTIVSNPPIRAGKKVIYPLFEESFDYLNQGGSIYMVIQKKQGAKSASEKLQEIYGNCETINKKGGYWILKSTK